MANSKQLLALSLLTATTAAELVTFSNQCDFTIELFHSQSGSAVAKVADIAPGATRTQDVSGPAHMFRHGFDTAATLVELACDGLGVWYDISIIPPGSGNCGSFGDCARYGSGWNVPLSIEPTVNKGVGSCDSLLCEAGDDVRCQDGYLFPADDTKTHNCPVGTAFSVVFCPGGGGSDNVSDADGTVEPYSGDDNEVASDADATGESYSKGGATGRSYGSLDVKATYSYAGEKAGNVAGTYNRVTSLNGCVKESVSVNSPVGPLSDEVTLVYRGPMHISDIAVYQHNGSWSRVSHYNADGGHTDNIVFMNNRNIDYSGNNAHGPQGYATADGKDLATEPTFFNGYLAEASDPSKIGAGPGIQTGTEINILTGNKCNGDCQGFAGSNDYHGWGGGKKIFVTRVKMPQGTSPNQPAIWMLNAQVVHSNQYGCNCRGMGAVGGCGELDIAEVIETNGDRNRVTTHYYFYDGSVLSPGGDNFAPRPYNDFTVYVTLIDDSGKGLVKILELGDFDFDQCELSADAVYQLATA